MEKFCGGVCVCGGHSHPAAYTFEDLVIKDMWDLCNESSKAFSTQTNWALTTQQPEQDPFQTLAG